MQEEDEVLNYNQEVVRADKEGNVNSVKSLKGVIKSYLQVDKSLITK